MKLGSVNIEVIDNGYMLRGSWRGGNIYLGNGGDCQMAFSTLDELLTFVRDRLLTPAELASVREDERARCELESAARMATGLTQVSRY